ncbi:DNA-binding protein [Chengkuizengella marina]|uniref:DNA-binding protein n=1 Tax=Chengkuizengella marina TaxID=2507566 RepID=A0A6N9Q0Q2_9BACL|nr:DNA-binding protein [Chengkuizengella marina]NBI28313.1 DNA-binding protein [Chengkuizengella marina]
MSHETMPDVLMAKHIKVVLSISERRAYEIMDLKSFPLIRIGRSKRVAKESFFRWLKEQESKNETLLG